MPIVFESNSRSDLTVFRLSGDVKVKELLRTIADYFKAGHTRLELYDLSEYDGTPFSVEDINRLADFVASRAGNYRTEGKTAVVAPRDIDFGNFRMLAALTDIETPYDFEVFRTRDTAIDWLGVVI